SIIRRLFFRLTVRILAPKFLFSVVQSVGNSVKPRIWAVAETLKVFLRHPIVIVGEIAQSDLFGDIVHVFFGEDVDDIFLLVSHRTYANDVPALPLCSTDSWHMPDVRPACILALNTKYPLRSGEANGEVPPLIKLRGSLPREGIGRAYDIMDHEVPTHCAEVEIIVFVLGVPQHASGVDLTFAFTCLVQDGFFQLVITF